MNAKIFVGAAVAVLGAILVGMLVAGPTMVSDLPGGVSEMVQGSGDRPAGTEFQPLQVTLDDIAVTKITDRSATIEIAFILHNPNDRSMIVQTLDYRLFETSVDGSSPLTGGQIGSRPGGFVEFGSNYYTLLSGGSITLRNTSVVPNSGDSQLWDVLGSDSASWRVTGDVFYNLSSMTSGQENELSFEFTH